MQSSPPGPHNAILTPWTSSCSPHPLDLIMQSSPPGPHNAILTSWTSSCSPHPLDLIMQSSPPGPSGPPLAPQSWHQVSFSAHIIRFPQTCRVWRLCAHMPASITSS
uniref:Uncharacterized protein n=1 Tax=Knipowitschia caucasica TaxID=637954 RepID=A0AAV2MPJ0_KNICA